MIAKNSGPAKSAPLSEMNHLVGVPLSAVLLYLWFECYVIGKYTSSKRHHLKNMSLVDASIITLIHKDYIG